MVEYKVIGVRAPYLEDELNRLAQQGWRMVGSHQENLASPATIIMERVG